MRILADPAFRNEGFNPYNALLYRSLQALGVEVDEFIPELLNTGGYDLWHLHWPDSVLARDSFASARKRVTAQLARLARARTEGTKIVWTTHNVQSHERRHPWLEAFFWKSFIPCVDGYISPSHAAQRAALRRFPRLHDVPGFVVPHGHYRDAYPDPVGRSGARDRLGIPRNRKVLLNPGIVRPYKNVPALLEAFREWRDPDAMLIVAGKVLWPGLEDEIRSRAEKDERVRLDLRLLDPAGLRLYLSAADLVVLPYKDILNSGSVLLSLSQDRPLLVPPLGAVLELREAVGPEWVGTYQGPVSGPVLRAGLEWARGNPRPPRAPLDPFDWNPLARQTLEAYREICGEEGRSDGWMRRFNPISTGMWSG
jgi:beta-1,4-mannosyltransferase